MIPSERSAEALTVPMRARPPPPVTAPPTAATAPPPRLHEIDLLRISTAMAVVFVHYLYSGPASGYIDVEFPTTGLIARYGHLGVDLFFVISGFVVLMSAWQRSTRQFIVSRVVRLYPAYWVAVTLTAVISALAGGILFPVTATQYLTNLTMLNSLVDVENLDVVHWTLWAELRFYAIIALLVLIGLSRRRVLTSPRSAWCRAAARRPLSGLIDLVVQSQFAHYFIAGAALLLIRRFGVSGEAAVLVVLCLGNACTEGPGSPRRWPSGTTAISPWSSSSP